jgi:hypothetical protein
MGASSIDNKDELRKRLVPTAERAFELAMLNVSNRPTLRALEQAYEIALAAGGAQQVAELFAAAKNRWGDTGRLALSRLAELISKEISREG